MASLISLLKTKAHTAYKNIEIKNHHLQYLFLEITRLCNLTCLHCGSDCTTIAAEKQLTPESWAQIISYISKTYGKSVCFVLTGGEPLCAPGLDTILKALKKSGNRWGLVTNGLLLSEDMLSTLIKHGLSSLTISLDGPKESHNYLRNKKGAFEKAVHAIDNAAASDIPMWDVVTCVHPGNLHQLDETAEILIRRGCKRWRLFRIFPIGRAGNNKKLYLNHQDTWNMLNWIIDNKPYYKKHGLNLEYACEGWVPFDIDRKIRNTPFFCRAGINIASILTDGSITGCPNNNPSFIQGNILNDNLQYIWQHRFQDFRKRMWLKDTVCAACKQVKSCRGSSIHLWQDGKKQPAFCYMEKKDTL